MYRGERLNSITHVIGTCLAVAGLVALVVFAAQEGNVWKVVSFSIYGATLVALYFFSALYHSIRGKAKTIVQKLDHTAIYLLIAGTYTPFTLVTLHGAWGWSLFGVIWGLALIGMLQDILFQKQRRILSVIIYLIMGWLVIIAIRPLTLALPQSGMMWLAAGGLSYTIGVVFYALDKSVPYGHGIFHLFVLVGSICHYCTIFLYVA